MKILALETSAKSVSTAVVENGAPLAYAYQCTGLTHSRTLMPMVDAMLKNAELTLGDMDAVAVAAGPAHSRACASASPRSRASPGQRTSRASAFPRSRRWRRISPTWTVCSSARWTRGAIRSTTRSLKRKAASSPASRPTAPSRSRSWRRSCAAKRAAFSCSATADSSAATGSLQLGVESELAPAQLLYQNAVGVGLAAEHGTPVSAQELAPVYLRISQAERERNARLQQEATQK